MLSLTREYRLLLRYGGNSLALTHPKDSPPVPLAPFEYTVLGRLRSLQCLGDHGYLLSNIKSVAVKGALKKCQQALPISANPSGVISAAAAERARQAPIQRTPEELEAVARAAANPSWMPGLVQSMLEHPERPCRYIKLEDLLHPNSISRFHLIVRRYAIVPQQQPPAAAAAAAAGPAAASSSGDKIEAAGAAAAAPIQYCYCIKDIGSLNGLYIDGVKIAHKHWTLLHEGARLRFAPQTRNAKDYIVAFHAADAMNEQLRRSSAPGVAFPLAVPMLPPTPLSVKDLHLEYIFTSSMNDACKQRVATLDAPMPNEDNDADDARPHAIYGFKPPGATAAAAAPASSSSAAAASGLHAWSAAPDMALLSAAAAANRKRVRDEDETAAAPASSAAAAAAAAEGGDSAAKRARVSASVQIASSSSAAAAAASSSSTATAPAASSATTTTTSIMEELTCAICSDVIYQCVVLDCGHSFCKSCICTWFNKKKKKLCPVCRNKHKGQPHAVRKSDTIIALMVKQYCSADEQAERVERIKRIDAEAAERPSQSAAIDEDDEKEEDEDDGFFALLYRGRPAAAAPAAAAGGGAAPAAGGGAAPAAAGGAAGAAEVAGRACAYSVDTARLPTSKCRTCNQFIGRDLLRLRHRGTYHHLQCYADQLPHDIIRGNVRGLDQLSPANRILADQLI